MEKVEKDSGHHRLRHGEVRGRGSEFQQSLEREAELSRGEGGGKHAEEGVDVKGEVFDRGLGVLRGGEDGEGDGVGGFEDGEERTATAGGEVGCDGRNEEGGRRERWEEEGEVLGGVEEEEVEGAVERVGCGFTECGGRDCGEEVGD
jgi:hypothetical protein